MIYGLITAREGSERLPHKNRLMIGDKPMIFWTIDAALAAIEVIETIVYTDDMKLINWIESEYNNNSRLKIIQEPKELAVDDKHYEAIFDAIKELKPDDTIVLLQPSSPFRTAYDINYFIEIYEEEHPLVAVDKWYDPCGAIYVIQKHDLLNCRSFFTPRTRFIPLPIPNSHDIDTLNDYELALDYLEEYL